MPLSPSIRVGITGIGIISPLGRNFAENTQALQQGRDAITEVSTFDVRVCMAKTGGQVPDSWLSEAAAQIPQAKRWNRATQMLFLACEEALKHRHLENDPGEHSKNTTLLKNFIPDRVIFGTTNGGMRSGETLYRAHARFWKDAAYSFRKASFNASDPDSSVDRIPSPAFLETLNPLHAHQVRRYLSQYLPQHPVQQILKMHGWHCPYRIISSACASGTQALGEAFRCIQFGYAKRILCGGYDELCELVFAGFDALRAMSTEKCRPFDSLRSGLILGEGAAVFLLEALTPESATSAHPTSVWAEITGYGNNTDVHHLTQPHPDGRGIRAAMIQALQQAQCLGTEIDYLNAHGTGTRFNDAAESQAIRSLCPTTPVSSTKAQMGHALGAAGALEAAFCVAALRKQFLPVNLNFRQQDEGMNLNVVQLEQNPAHTDSRSLSSSFKPPSSIQRILSNSIGFGGSNAALILEKTRQST